VKATEILSIQHPDAISIAKKIIQKNGTIAFPTDTVYGLAAHAFSPAGIQKIYQAKQRPTDKALPVLIGNLQQLPLLTSSISKNALAIASAFWPGALTLLLPKSADLPLDLTPYPTIGIRMPDYAFTLKLLNETGPLATTSANISGGLNPVNAREVLDQLDGRVDLILDGGQTPGGTASTVIDASGYQLKVLRQGPISLDDVHALFNQE
jgi:L-threonylcarbamoyladenylate synthase